MNETVECLRIYRYSNIIPSKEENRIILNEIESLSQYYPNIGKWFIRKVVPNIGRDREILLVKNKENITMGFAILKFKKKWLKISTFKIGDKYQHEGVGYELLNYILKEFDYKDGCYITFKDMCKFGFCKLFNKILNDNNGFKHMDFSKMKDSEDTYKLTLTK